LNNCGLTDQEVVLLCTSVRQYGNTKLAKLFLNQNNLSNKSALVVAELIADSGLHLKEIGLKWNKITAIGGNAIAVALESNS